MNDQSITVENDLIPNKYPNIIYTVEPTLQYLIQLLRILQWKKGYTQQSIILTLIWTFICFHPFIISYTTPVWIALIVYFSFITEEHTTEEDEAINISDKLTVELKEIQLELSLILPSPDSKDKFRQWCRIKSQFVLDQRLQYQSSLFISIYTLWVAVLHVFGISRVIWFIGCLFLTWNSSLLQVIRLSYHRASFIFQQSIFNNNNNNHTREEVSMINKMTTNKQRNNDHIERFYRFAVIEHQRWWLHCGWSSLLLANDRPDWSDEYLSKVPHIKSFQLPQPTTRIKDEKTIKISWKWITEDWEIDQNHNIDKNGWEYGIDWKSWSSKSFGLRVLTRRRHWIRDARLVEEIIDLKHDNQSIMTTTSSAAISIPRLIKSNSTTTTTSSSFEDSSLCTTPTISSPISFEVSSTTSTTTNKRHHSTVKHQQQNYPTMDNHPWLLR